MKLILLLLTLTLALSAMAGPSERSRARRQAAQLRQQITALEKSIEQRIGKGDDSANIAQEVQAVETLKGTLARIEAWVAADRAKPQKSTR
jgi:hypothetical protein